MISCLIIDNILSFFNCPTTEFSSVVRFLPRITGGF
nr:MAG TPA: hypothetical protein [Caudoviricetes sp.]